MASYNNPYDPYNRNARSQNHNANQFYSGNANQVSVHSFTNAPMTFIATTTVNFMQRHYMMTFLWAVGLLIVSLARGHAVDAPTQKEFDHAMDEADRIEQTHLNDAYLNQQAQYDRYYRSKGWFSCDSYCQTNYQRYLDAKQQLADAKKLHDAALSEARSIVGIFSDYAVKDARNVFWGCWKWGKDFAKRISWYDAFFIALDSRNESFGVYVARMVIRVLINFTLGFISALVAFVWQLWWFVRSYRAGIAGIAFFILGSIAAFSLVASAIGAMFIGTAGAAAVVVNMAGPSLEGARRRRRVHHQ
eukprot:139523_1